MVGLLFHFSQQLIRINWNNKCGIVKNQRTVTENWRIPVGLLMASSFSWSLFCVPFLQSLKYNLSERHEMPSSYILVSNLSISEHSIIFHYVKINLRCVSFGTYLRSEVLKNAESKWYYSYLNKGIGRYFFFREGRGVLRSQCNIMSHDAHLLYCILNFNKLERGFDPPKPIP